MAGDLNPEGWWEYQKRIKGTARRRYLLRRLPKLGLCAGSAFLVLTLILYGGSWIFAHLERGERIPIGDDKKGEGIWPQSLDKKDLSSLLRDIDLYLSSPTRTYVVPRKGVEFRIETFIDPALQEYILGLLGRSLTYQSAVVVLRPSDGQILAMADYDKGGAKRENLCLKANFPAASLFKIVSAAAAIQEKGFTPDRAVIYKGRKYTLYKSQLKEGKSRYVTKTIFKRAFSGSINPVFGRIGIYDLGREVLNEYAVKFFFNHMIPFELPVSVSRIHVPEDDFGLAEIASGFNKRTLLSPLHAALIAAAVANNGVMMEPKLVKMVSDGSGRVLYSARSGPIGNPIKEKTAEKLRVLMQETVKSGTCRKAFYSLRRKRSFREIELGAKTGTINDSSDQYKVDWLTAYAIPPNGGEGICIAVLAIHEEKLGIRANDLARHIINFHFT
ncbi:MAG: penicillin-binding transpeptidase domain-containing protein [Pseudomonadota bacterium]